MYVFHNVLNTLFPTLSVASAYTKPFSIIVYVVPSPSTPLASNILVSPVLSDLNF